jgi:hypothetical protein
MQGSVSEAAIWMLNPYSLNEKSVNEDVVKYLNSEYPKGYERYFIPEIEEQFPGDVVAIGSDSRADRVRSQRRVFTLHRELTEPLEKLYPDSLRKVLLPIDAVTEATVFLRLAGINNFSLFPDLDGLANYLKSQELDIDTDAT